MSAGQSFSSGSDWNKSRSGADKASTQVQNQTGLQRTSFNNTSTTSTDVPKWALQANKSMALGRVEDERGARDFLSSLLTDPYDDSQPRSRYGDAIDRLFDTQMARARGGTAQTGVARQGFREGAALSGAQDAVIGQGANAANSLLVNANALQNLDWSRLVADTTRTDVGSGTTYDSRDARTVGRESTSASEQSNGGMSGENSGYGITLCCFIFMEHYKQTKMPWFVRRCRDEFASGPRVEGYRRMAKYLVPAMTKSRLVSGLVQWLMIEPLTLFGGWLYQAEGRKYRFGWLMTPFVMFWFMLWACMGQTFNLEPGE